MHSGKQSKGKLRVRFSLRSLLLLTLVTSILLSTVGYRLVQYRREAAVATRLEEVGALIEWTLTSKDRWSFNILRRLELGYLFLRIRGINLDATTVTPEMLDDLASLSELRQLRINRCSFQADVASLNQLKSLDEFELSSNLHIEDEDLTELRLPHVQTWRLDQRVSDYETLDTVAANNPNLDATALIRNKSLFELKRLRFPASTQYRTRWKWHFGESLDVGNVLARRRWISAKPHLDMYPGPMRANVLVAKGGYAAPEREGTPMFLSSIVLKIRPIGVTDQQIIPVLHEPINERPDAVALIPESGQLVVQVSAAHDIHVWTQAESQEHITEFQLIVGKQVAIPQSTSTIYVSSNSLPIRIETTESVSDEVTD